MYTTVGAVISYVYRLILCWEYITIYIPLGKKIIQIQLCLLL